MAERIIAGDGDAVRTLVVDYTPHLWRRACGLLQDVGLAEDAVQETFLKGLRCMPDYRGTGPLLGWFLRICHHHCLDKLKGRSGWELKIDFDGSQPSTVELGRDWEDNAVHRQLLRDAFARLEPEMIRRAAVLVLVRGLTREEAAQVLGVPSSTVRTWVKQARQRLAEMIMQAMNGEQS